MITTFLLGNGFDINFGLNTRYANFIDWYINQPSEDETIDCFKNLIAKDIIYWSDLEFALGRYSNKHPLNTEPGFFACKNNMDSHLKKYLSIENLKALRKPSRKTNKKFKDSLLNYSQYCNHIDLQRICDLRGFESNTINILTLNYTSTIDVLWNKLPFDLHKKSFLHRLFTRRSLEHSMQDLKGELIHLHGTLEKNMIVGINDASQLTDNSLKTSSKIHACCVKPIMNKQCDEEQMMKACNIIGTTDIFIVYGASLGATDKFWLEQIVNRVISNPKGIIIVFGHDSALDQALPYLAQQKKEMVLSKLSRSAGLDTENTKILNSKTIFISHHKIFDVKLKKSIFDEITS